MSGTVTTLSELAAKWRDARASLNEFWPAEEYVAMERCASELEYLIPGVEKLLAEARLGEAEWWREQSHEGAICSTQDCEQCRRVAELRALAGSSGKQSEVGNHD